MFSWTDGSVREALGLSADLADPVSDDDAIEDDDAIGADDTGSEALAAGGDDVASDEDEPRTDSVD